MKLICLNIWGGRAGRGQLLAFFEQYRDSTDIFCLQEVWKERYDQLEGKNAGGRPISNDHIMTHAFQDISAVLPDHIPYFRPSFLEHYGLCIFVRNGVEVREEGDVFVHEERGFMPPPEEVGLHARNMQYVSVQTSEGPRLVLNVHGLWNGRGKGDSNTRLRQSERIIEFINSRPEPSVLCGDFNLTPDTQSLQKIEQSGLRNLIAEFGITSTRTSLYDKAEQYADYAFVSSEIHVNEFKVLPEEVSDHVPLYLDFT